MNKTKSTSTMSQFWLLPLHYFTVGLLCPHPSCIIPQPTHQCQEAAILLAGPKTPHHTGEAEDGAHGNADIAEVDELHRVMAHQVY